MQILITTDLGKLQRQFQRLSAHEVRFSTAQAITQVVRAAESDVRQALPQVLDRPNPFTLLGPGSQGALASNLTGRVYIRDAQAKYLALQETGGIRHPESGRRALVVPTALSQRDAYGNLPRNALASLKGRRDVFVGAVRGIYGVWQRQPGSGGPGGLRLVIAMRHSARYRPRLGFNERVASVVTTQMPVALRAAMAAALARSKG